MFDLEGLAKIQLDKLGKEVIEQYFELDERILKVNRSIEQLNNDFYAQSFFPSPFDIAEDGIHRNREPSLENKVINYVDTLTALEKVRSALKFKNKTFKGFLDTLTSSQISDVKQSLKENKINHEVLDDILEIIRDIESKVEYKYRF